MPLPRLQMLSQLAMLWGSLLLLVATMSVAQQTGQEAGRGCETLVVQHGHCSYTFLLPKPEPCPPGPEASRDSNTLQRESLANPLRLEKLPTQQVKRLEQALQNNTQWLKKVWGMGGLQGAEGGFGICHNRQVERPSQRPSLSTEGWL